MIDHKQKDNLPIKVLITSAYSDDEPIKSMLRYASLDRIGKFSVTDNPDEAVLILFIENSRHHSDRYYVGLKAHPLVKKYPEKVFMYNPHDKPWLVLPGLYASMPRKFFDEDYMAATPYIERINPYIEYRSGIKPKYLFSFVGSPNSGPRRNILKLSYIRAVIGASHKNMFGDQDVSDEKKRYAELISQSKFVLCPKGAGTSSFRIFETMQAGRVPVIISDDWVAPPGPLWKEFALFVPEKDVASILQILEAAEHEWTVMAQKSKQAWDEFFAPDVFFTYQLETVLQLRKTYKDVSFSTKSAQAVPYLKYVFRVTVIQNVKAALAFIR